jgi:thiol-disulfide isomerase/thioredoxin
MISIQSLAAIERPMKQPMGYILNQVLNAESTSEKIEAEPVMMKNYQLFVYVGSSCGNCKDFLPTLSTLASKYKSSLNVVLVYDYSSKNLEANKAQFAQTATFEFFDEKGLMYHTLFNQPQFLDYVLTGPKHTMIAESKITKLQDIYNFQSWLNRKN